MADDGAAIKGLIAGSSLVDGAFIAKRFVLRLEPEVFRPTMDVIMLAAGDTMLLNAFIGAHIARSGTGSEPSRSGSEWFERIG